MIAEARVTVRNAGLLLLQQGLSAGGGFLFAILVPRLMGPATYGRFTLVVSLSLWFVLFSALGFTPVIGRYVPHLVLQGERERLRAFFGNLLAVRLGSGMMAASLYLLFTVLWLQDIDPAVLVIVAGAVFVRAVANLLFALFLGLNQAARWGMSEIVYRWLSLALLIPGFLVGGLRGACLGLLLAAVVVLVVGAGWTRTYLSWSNLRLDLHPLVPCLRFGLIFFASDLLLTTFQRSGEALVRTVAGDYAQVGYFGLAHDMYLSAIAAIGQLALAFAPLLMTLLVQGRTASLRRWTELLLKWLAVGGMLVVFGALLLGEDLVPLVLGAAYRPVTANLVPLTLTLLVVALSSVARLLALVYDRPGVALRAAAIRLAVFWACGLPLIAWQGSLGGCLAVLAASAIYAVYFTWQMRRTARYSLRPWATVIVAGGLFLPLALLRSSWAVNATLYGVFVVGYGGLLLLLRAVTPGEIVAAWQALRAGESG